MPCNLYINIRTVELIIVADIKLVRKYTVVILVNTINMQYYMYVHVHPCRYFPGRRKLAFYRDFKFSVTEKWSNQFDQTCRKF
jgi:hypothetical protein